MKETARLSPETSNLFLKELSERVFYFILFFKASLWDLVVFIYQPIQANFTYCAKKKANILLGVVKIT